MRDITSFVILVERQREWVHMDSIMHDKLEGNLGPFQNSKSEVDGLRTDVPVSTCVLLPKSSSLCPANDSEKVSCKGTQTGSSI